jgi:tetratricopeptide (TPR) repeat protein
MKLTLAAALSLALSIPVIAQHAGHDAAPPAQVSLDPGLSDLHWAVTTANAEAQKFFDQGMRYTYAFNHDMAIASFRHATDLDPELALGYWGIALALGPNINLDVDPDREKQAYATVQAAMAHLSTASQKETDLVHALAKRYTNDETADLHALAGQYSAAMKELAAKYPEDDNIATLYAESLMDLRPWKFWSHDGKPAEGTEEIVRVLESVLARNPKHIGANHYYIHAVEASAQPERARASATRLQTLAPAAGHLVHMPAHIFQRTGDYAGAAKANEEGARADREFMQAHGAEGIYPLMYYNHNLQFGSASHAMQGNLAAAKQMADEMADNAGPIAKEMAMVESVVAAPILVLTRFARWTDILRTPLHEGAGPLARTYWHLARGTAFARLGNVLGAQSELKDLESTRTQVPDDNAMFQNSQKQLAAIASRLLQARILEASGETERAIGEYEAAITLEDALNYDEPSDFYYPIRETLGALYLRAHRYSDAARVFAADLEKNPHNPRSSWGLATAQRALKQDAARSESDYRKRWKGAPLKLADF